LVAEKVDLPDLFNMKRVRVMADVANKSPISIAFEVRDQPGLNLLTIY
jgi:hypothetical protein